jgi:hypothetical protein
MLNGFLRFARANTIALIALFIALGGTTFAATGFPRNSIGAKQLKKNAVTNPKIKRNAVTGAKIANNSVTGADVLESSLGRVPSATNATHATTADNATTVGGASVNTLSIGRSTSSTDASGTGTSCDPNTTAFVDCGTVAMTLPRSARVLILADAAFDGSNSFGNRGDCQITVDGARIGGLLSAGSVNVNTTTGTVLIGPGYNANTQDGIALNAVTGVLTAGAHSFALQCNQAGGSIEFSETYVSAVMLGAG